MNISGIKEGVFSKIKDQIAAVSYTHLDVYKRQLLIQAAIRPAASSLSILA